MDEADDLDAAAAAHVTDFDCEVGPPKPPASPVPPPKPPPAPNLLPSEASDGLPAAAFFAAASAASAGDGFVGAERPPNPPVPVRLAPAPVPRKLPRPDDCRVKPAPGLLKPPPEPKPLLELPPPAAKPPPPPIADAAAAA